MKIAIGNFDTGPSNGAPARAKSQDNTSVHMYLRRGSIVPRHDSPPRHKNVYFPFKFFGPSPTRCVILLAYKSVEDPCIHRSRIHISSPRCQLVLQVSTVKCGKLTRPTFVLLVTLICLGLVWQWDCYIREPRWCYRFGPYIFGNPTAPTFLVTYIHSVMSYEDAAFIFSWCPVVSEEYMF